MTQRTFKKSSRSGGSGGNCVEWAIDDQGVWVRDSKDPLGPQVHMTRNEWDGFVEASLTEARHPWISVADTTTIVAKGDVSLRFTRPEWEAFLAGARVGECLVPV